MLTKLTRAGVLAAFLGVLLAANRATAGLSATATLGTTSTSAPYDYTIQLTNTGDQYIEGFWFAWTPPDQANSIPEYDLMQSAPTVQFTGDGPNTYWYGYDTPGSKPGGLGLGHGIEWYDYYYDYYGQSTIYGIGPGQSGTFHFISNDSPAALAGSVAGVPITTSVLYAGFVESSTDTQFNVNVNSVPEPSTRLLMGLGGILGWIVWRRR